MARAGRPSELEHVVLALVSCDGPSTPYAIRRHFLASPTASWSGSAGAIYPLVRRLEGRGLLRSSPRATDARGTRRYAITARGRRALEGWLVADEDALALGDDPARTRLFFLGALPPAARERFLSGVERAIAAELARLRAALEQRGPAPAADPYAPEALRRLAGDGALALARARQRWWRTVRRALAPPRA